jgi:hypothetical protein
MDAIGVECQFTFSHLSEDKNTSVFADRRGDYEGYLKGTFDDILREWASNINLNFEDTHHTIEIASRDLNDTPIPGISINYEAAELSCDWRGLFTAFYCEQLLYERLMGKWERDEEPWTEEVKQSIVEVVSEDQHSWIDLLNPEDADKYVAEEWCRMRARRVRIARVREKGDGRERTTSACQFSGGTVMGGMDDGDAREDTGNKARVAAAIRATRSFFGFNKTKNGRCER